MIRLRKLLSGALVVGVVAAIAGAATWSAFSGTTANPGNTFATGTVNLTDNDGNGSLWSLANATPGTTATGCIKMTYNGSLDADVKLFANVSGALGQYLTLEVTRGTDSGSTFPGCDGFTADTRDYIGQGAGVIYKGTLASFPSSYATGIADPDNGGGAETWTTSEVRAYKLKATLGGDSAAQGQSMTASFTWEARNR